jgi:hypothetical protein
MIFDEHKRRVVSIRLIFSISENGNHQPNSLSAPTAQHGNSSIIVPTRVSV